MEALNYLFEESFYIDFLSRNLIECIIYSILLPIEWGNYFELKVCSKFSFQISHFFPLFLLFLTSLPIHFFAVFGLPVFSRCLSHSDSDYSEIPNQMSDLYKAPAVNMSSNEGASYEWHF